MVNQLEYKLWAIAAFGYGTVFALVMYRVSQEEQVMSDRTWSLCVLVLAVCTFLSAENAHATEMTCTPAFPATVGVVGGLIGVGVSSLVVPLSSELADDQSNAYDLLPNMGWTFLASAGTGALGVGIVALTGCDLLDDADAKLAYALAVPMVLSFVGAGVVQTFLWKDAEVQMSLSPTMSQALEVDGAMGMISWSF